MIDGDPLPTLPIDASLTLTVTGCSALLMAYLRFRT